MGSEVSFSVSYPELPPNIFPVIVNCLSGHGQELRYLFRGSATPGKVCCVHLLRDQIQIQRC